jgi:uncharacterized membrane protein YczE
VAARRRALAVVVAGLGCLALGIVGTVRAGLGLDPWTVLFQGAARSGGTTLGHATLLGFAGLLAVNYLVGRERPGLATLASVGLEGPLIDLYDGLLPAAGPRLLARALWFAGGTLAMAFGIALYVTPRLGAAPPEGLMFAVGRRAGLSLPRARLLIDGLALLAGIGLGGEVGVGTVLLVGLVGPLMGRGQALLSRVPGLAPPGGGGGPSGDPRAR